MPFTSRNDRNPRDHYSDVPRPPLPVWQTLESEGIRWEGQVLIVGQGTDLPALLVITRERLALIANNDIAVEFPRGWMRPAPKLTAENGIRLYISPNGDSQISQPMLLRARAGRGAALEIAAALNDQSFASRANAQEPLHIPNWNDRVGASRAVALPSIPEAAPRQSASAPSWPPQETTGVTHAATGNHGPAVSRSGRPMEGLIGERAPRPWLTAPASAPTPVPSADSRSARAQATDADGVTISDAAHRPAITRTEVQREPRARGRTALFNVVFVALLLAGFGYVAHDRGYTLDDARDLVPGSVQSWFTREPIATDNQDDIAMNTAPETAPTQPANGSDNQIASGQTAAPTGVPTAPPTSLPVEDGPIGGPSQSLPVTADSDGVTATETEAAAETEVATETPTEVATEEPTEIATEEPTEVATEAPTEVATEAPTEVATETPTEVATETPTEVATETPTEVATETPTEVATETPTEVATETPTEVATETPTEATTNPTEPQQTPAPTIAPTQTVTQSQEASVAEGSAPAQELVSGGIRYRVNAVASGASITELPQINNIGQTWVVVTLTGTNDSTTDQAFSMSNFSLIADGATLQLDTGTAWVNSLLGNQPAYGATDSATWAPGESHQFTLTFLAPAGVSNLTLVAGDTNVDLNLAGVNATPLTTVSRDQPPTGSIEGTVVDVIDGQTIVVDVNGERITVRYLSIDAPTGDACYATEATAGNAELVQGQTVRLERQATDVNARGNWVRDVWVVNPDGTESLVSQELVQEGMATVNVSEPNTRFAAWLTSTQNQAESNGTGLWSTCGN